MGASIVTASGSNSVVVARRAPSARLDRAAVRAPRPAPDLDEQRVEAAGLGGPNHRSNMRFSGERRAKDPQPARLTGRYRRRRLGRRVVRTGAHDGRGGKERRSREPGRSAPHRSQPFETSPMWSGAEAAR